MNIVYVLSDSPVEPCGGLGERLRKLIPELEKAGINIYCYCAGTGGYYSKTYCKNIEFVTPDYGNPYPFFYTNFVLDNRPPFKPDFVIATDYPTVIAAKALAAIYGAKLITEFHLAYYSLRNALNEDELRGDLKLDQAAKLVYLVEEIAAKSSDLVIGCSKNYIEELPWATKRAVAIQNGIDYENYEGPFERYKFAGGKKRNLVFIGRMNSQKGLKYLMDYYHSYDGDTGRRYMMRLPDEQRLILPDDTALHFVGGSVGADQYYAMLETVNDSDQKFHIPFIMGKEKINILRSADAILFPSVHEPFGIVGLEALASGTPLITTRVNGIADYADDMNSIKCETNAPSIRRAIDQLFQMSDADRQAMVTRGKETTRKFGWDVVAKTMIEELNLLHSKREE